MSGWTWGWIGWFTYLVVYETYTIVNKVPGDTLSETLRNWFQTKTKKGKFIWLASFGLFAAWFVVHIAVPGSV